MTGQLPKLLRLENDIITCLSCGRHWRAHLDGHLKADNRAYLLEHVLTHVRASAHRPAQQNLPKHDDNPAV